MNLEHTPPELPSLDDGLRICHTCGQDIGWAARIPRWMNECEFKIDTLAMESREADDDLAVLRAQVVLLEKRLEKLEAA